MSARTRRSSPPARRRSSTATKAPPPTRALLPWSAVTSLPLSPLGRTRRARRMRNKVVVLAAEVLIVKLQPRHRRAAGQPRLHQRNLEPAPVMQHIVNVIRRAGVRVRRYRAMFKDD